MSLQEAFDQEAIKRIAFIPRVAIESPYRGETERNTQYARAAMADCFRRGESPYASHLLYTQPGVLRDEVAEERTRGIEAGYTWTITADLVAFYVDLGWSPGMHEALKLCTRLSLKYEYRSLEGWHKD